MAVLVDMRLSGPAEIAAGCNGLALVNLSQLRGGMRGRWRGVYRTCRYRREPPHADHWQTIRDLARSRAGDCEDLAAARCAELWQAGDRRARCVIKLVRPGLMHVVVRRGDGRLEDPSRSLGMQGDG